MFDYKCPIHIHYGVMIRAIIHSVLDRIVTSVVKEFMILSFEYSECLKS